MVSLSGGGIESRRWQAATGLELWRICWLGQTANRRLSLSTSTQSTGSSTTAQSSFTTTRLRSGSFPCESPHQLTLTPQCILDDIRAHRIPVDFLGLFDDARVPFYDGKSPSPMPPPSSPFIQVV